MNRLHTVFALAMLVVCLPLVPAFGQLPYSRPSVGPAGPTVSPYINLTRQGSSPAINYYGIVRPELETRQAVRRLSSDVQALETAEPAPAQEALPATGHRTTFMNYSQYFMTYTPGGLPGRGVGAGRPPGAGLGRPPAQRR